MSESGGGLKSYLGNKEQQRWYTHSLQNAVWNQNGAVLTNGTVQ